MIRGLETFFSVVAVLAAALTLSAILAALLVSARGSSVVHNCQSLKDAGVNTRVVDNGAWSDKDCQIEFEPGRWKTI